MTLKEVSSFRELAAARDDIRFASDTTDSDGDWSTGNTGTAGKFYAK